MKSSGEDNWFYVYLYMFYMRMELFEFPRFEVPRMRHWTEVFHVEN